MRQPFTVTINRVVRPDGLRQESVWVLYANLPRDNDASYSLQVRYDALSTGYRFIENVMGDETELVTKAAWVDRRNAIILNENLELVCPTCDKMTDAEREIAWQNSKVDDLGFTCKGCRESAEQQADEMIDQQNVRRERPGEADIREHLVRTWESFAFLFNPAYTL